MVNSEAFLQRIISFPVITELKELTDPQIAEVYALIQRRLADLEYPVPPLRDDQMICTVVKDRVWPDTTKEVACQTEDTTFVLMILDELEEIITYHLSHKIVSTTPYDLQEVHEYYSVGKKFIAFLVVELETSTENILDVLASEYLRSAGSDTVPLSTMPALSTTASGEASSVISGIWHRAYAFLQTSTQHKADLITNESSENTATPHGLFYSENGKIQAVDVQLSHSTLLRLRGVFLGLNAGAVIGAGIQPNHEVLWTIVSFPSLCMIFVLSLLSLNDFSILNDLRMLRRRRKKIVVHEILHRLSISHAERDHMHITKKAFRSYRKEE